jgi:serine protease
LLVTVTVAAFILPAAAPAEDEAPATQPVAGQETTQLGNGAEAVAGEVLVGYSGNPAPRAVPIPEQADPAAVARKIEDHSGVRYAIPNYVAHTSGWLPNDNGVNPGRRGSWGGWRSKQWNFLPCLSLCHGSLPSDRPQSRGGMNVTRAWQHMRRAGRPGAAGVKVAVIDTGIAYRRYGQRFRRSPDLGAHRFLPGYDFVDNDRIPLDLNGHGTHVASTIGEQTNNRRNLTGIAYRAKLMPVRVMDANGDGNTEDIVAGVRWATRHGARVISMSLNFTCGLSVPPLREALRQAWKKGVVLVGSSGNIGNEACPSLPATAPQVISVGGSTETGCVSTYTFESATIDIAAPGGGRDRSDCPWSSRNRPILQLGMIGRDPSWFGIEPIWIGTSMAAAHVAGAAAAVIASGVLGNRSGPGRVADRLEKTARLPGYAADDPASGFGAGIVDLGQATNPAVTTD